MVRAVSPKAAAEEKEESKPLQTVGGAFAPLGIEESDEEEEAPGFQSQKDLYAEKKQRQEEHAEKEKKKKMSRIFRQAMVPPPPHPTTNRPLKKTKRTYVPFACMPKPDELSC